MQKFNDYLTESMAPKVRGYTVDIEKITTNNNYFRKVLYTAKHIQMTIMAIGVGDDIGEEKHPNDQFFRIEKGNGVVVINGHKTKVGNGDAVIVPAGAVHNIINTGKETLKLYTLYGPPHHRDGVIHKAKKDAVKDKEHFNGKTTEHL